MYKLMIVVALIYTVGLQSPGYATNFNDPLNQMTNSMENSDNLPIKARISINTDGHSPVLTIEYENNSSRSLYLIEDAFPVLIIKKSDGGKLRDISTREKRKPYTLDDYIKLEPGHSIEFKHSLIKRFEFPKGKHTYIVRFYKSYYDPITADTFTGETVDLEFEWSNI